jgi:hypothetical protein
MALTLSFTTVTALAQNTASRRAAQAAAAPAPFVWATVANSATVIPGGDGRTFNSFNQPSVNSTGLVALRARSKGGQTAGEPLRGIYARQMGGVAGPLDVVFDTLTEVPQPNNTLYSEKLGTFTEFPAFPRIGLTNNTIASRGQSKPVYTYYLSDNTETRAGTSGVYVRRLGERVSAMTQLGAAPGLTISAYRVQHRAQGSTSSQVRLPLQTRIQRLSRVTIPMRVYPRLAFFSAPSMLGVLRQAPR